MKPLSISEGDRFGRLVVQEVLSQNGRRSAACRCDCGAVATPRVDALIGGRTTSCGCLHRERSAEAMKAVGAMTQHGLHQNGRHPLFATWSMMHQRCNNPKHISYPRYGGRGIKVVARWSDFAAFVDDMGAKPSPDLTLDRIDNDGDYEPGNCRWATPTEQYANRTVITGATHANAKLTESDVRAIRASHSSQSELARKFGVSCTTISSILKRRTWAWLSDGGDDDLPGVGHR